jgi:hypothetical protein
VIELFHAKSLFRKAAILSASVISLAAFGLPAHANLVTNGSFESTSLNTSGLIQGGDVTGWSTAPSGSNIMTCLIYKGQNSLCGPTFLYPGSTPASFWVNPGESPDGGNAVVGDANPSNSVALTQSISGLTPGTSYTLSFYQASASEYNNGDSSTEDWQVSLGSQTENSATMNTSAEGVTPWTLQTLTFTATSATETLSFLAGGTPVGGPPMALLDGVDLEVAVPEPASVALFGLSVLGLLGVCKSRMRSAAV